MKYFWIFLAIFPIIVWTIRDKGYPTNDAGFYMLDAQENFSFLKKDGLVEGSKEILHKGRYKPILHPQIATIFLLATNGDTRLAAKLFNLFFLLLFSFVTFKILNSFLDPTSSGLGLVLLNYTNWVFISSQFFNSELPLFTFTLLALNFFNLFQTQKTQRNIFLYFLFWALAIMCRPIEAMLFGLPLSIVLICQSYKIRKLSAPLIFALVMFVFLNIVHMFYRFSLKENIPEIFIFFLFALAITSLFLSFSKNTHQYFWSILAFVSMTTMYFSFQSYSTIYWIFDTSFGESVQRVNGTLREQSIFGFLERIISTLGLFAPLLFLTAKILKSSSPFSKIQNLAITASIFFLPTIAIFSPSKDTRYFYLNFVLVALLSIIYFVKTIHKKFAQRILVYLATIQALMIFWPETLKNPLRPLSFLLFGTHIQYPHIKNESTSLVFLNKFKESVPFKANILLIQNYLPFLPQLDLFGVQVASNEIGLDWSMMVWDKIDSSKKLETFEYAVVGPVFSAPYEPLKFQAELASLMELSNEEIKKIKLKFLKEIHYSFAEKDYTFYLMKKL